MKRKLPAILTGATAGILAAGLLTTALAAYGSVKFDAVTISVFGEKEGQTIASGDSFTGENGAQIPSSITYVDEKNGGTVFVSLRKMAQLLDAPIFWDEETQTVYFAGRPSGKPDVDTGLSELPPSGAVETPELGVTAGPFREIAPVEDAVKGSRIPLLAPALFQSSSDFSNQRYDIFEPYGRYVEITVTNHGSPVEMYVCRPYYTTVGIDSDPFSTVLVGTGETVTRAFLMEQGAPYPTNILRLDVQKASHDSLRDALDITVSVEQYQLTEYPD